MHPTIRVLHFYKTALPDSTGGVEVFMDALCSETADLGVQNTLLSLSKCPARTPVLFPKYCVIQTRALFFIASTGFSADAFLKFAKLAQSADIIHYHFPNPFADMLHFICRVQKPTVVTYHSDIVRQKYWLKLYRPLMHQFLGSMHGIVATSPNYVATSPVLKRFKHKVTVIPLGLSQKKLPSPCATKVAYWRQKLPGIFFLFIGVMRAYKGLYTALDAISGTHLHLVLAGDGGIAANLRQYARKRHITGAHFIGSISDADKAALLHLCRGFVFPSHLRSEAFGIALLEAAAYAKPLISTEIGTGTSYVNVHKETGIVIPPCTPAALAEAMHYLRVNPKQAQQWGRNAKTRYRKLFTSDDQAKRYVALYQNLVRTFTKSAQRR